MDNKVIAHHISDPLAHSDIETPTHKPNPTETHTRPIRIRVESGDLVVIWTNRSSHLSIQVGGLQHPEIHYFKWSIGREHFKGYADRYREQTVGSITAQLLQHCDIDTSLVKEILSQFGLFAFAKQSPSVLVTADAFKFLVLKTCLEGTDAIRIQHSRHLAQILPQLLKNLQKLSLLHDLELPAIVVLDPCSQYGLAALAGEVLEEKHNGILEEVQIDY